MRKKMDENQDPPAAGQAQNPIWAFWRAALSGADVESWEFVALRAAVPNQPAVHALLSQVTSGQPLPRHPYTKWVGAHWVLAQLADLGYPPGDGLLLPLRDQVYQYVLPHPGRASPYRPKMVLEGRVRGCASQEGNALFASVRLGLMDERTPLLAQGLAAWQWLDGGWNCDKNPAAARSSFHETLIPLRGLAAYARAAGDDSARAAAERAAERLLARELFLRSDGSGPMDESFLRLAYPSYWHYGVLPALQVMAEGGWLADPRCRRALDWLESRRLPGGGWPADVAYYHLPRPGREGASQESRYDWGGAGANRPNPWVTALAEAVLAAAGRLPGSTPIAA